MKRVCPLVLLTWFLAVSAPARGAEWRVSPIRLEFSRGARTGVITVFNESEERLHVQMRAAEWTQDAEGKDRYEDTSDILFFPKIMVFEKKEDRILRAGIKIPAVKKERTYRLFIEEIPGPRKTEGAATVSIAVRFGVPIFVRPVLEEAKGEIGEIAMERGVVTARVRNSGNLHFVIKSVTVQGANGSGEQVFARDLSGWYLLAGASRRYSTEIPGDVCGEMARITVEVKTDRFPLVGELAADKAMCGP